jgi:hypothetical protein
MKAVLDRWDHFWFEPIPTHIYALLRIVLGFVGCLMVIGLADLPTMWYLDGFVPIGTGGLGIKAFLVSHGLGDVAGTVLYVCTLLAFVGMTVGFQSGLSVALAFITSLIQVSWNYLPLSAADAALKAMLFCLIWADCGSVWSADAWIASRRSGVSASDSTYAIAPLRLFRFQIALIYLNAGLWKLLNPYWSDGSAVHYVLESNVYRRFPYELPVSFDALVPLLTYGTLFWELAFAPLVLFKRTRPVALAAGVLLHLGMLLTIEIGPFHVVMLASYLAFLDPRTVPTLPKRLWDRKRDHSLAGADIRAVRS